MLDLFENVRAEQDGAPFRAEPGEQIKHLQALPRIHPVEGLIEQQNLGVVDKRGRHLDPLPHAL